MNHLSIPATSVGPPSDLERRLSLFDATMIIVGSIVGMGIFATTGWVADVLPNPYWIMAVWAAGGLLTLCGALTYAELGAALPKAGGEYVYLREAYGPFVGFLNGWTYFLISNPGSIAVMSVALMAYLERFLPLLSAGRIAFEMSFPTGKWVISTGQLAAVAIILFFSGVNYVGVRSGSVVQNLLTLAKLGAIISLAGLGLLVGNGSWEHFSNVPVQMRSSTFLGSLSLAMLSVFFSYTGWFTSSYVASEIKHPQRNVPRSIIYGTVIVMLLYLFINLAYLYALPVAEMRGVVNVGEVASIALFGSGISTFVSVAIIVSILGAINSVILTAPRIYFAMARDGLFFQTTAEVHPRFKTPANSILVQALWSSLLVMTGTFTQLLTYTTVAMLAFSIMTGCAVMVLRQKRPDMARPYRTHLYPWIPLIFVSSYLLILGNILVRRPWETLFGLGIVLLGAPAYFFWKRRAGKSK